MASWLQKISSGNESRSRNEKMMKWVFQTLAVRPRLKNSISSSFNQNPLPSGQRIRENAKIFSLEKIYS